MYIDSKKVSCHNSLEFNRVPLIQSREAGKGSGFIQAKRAAGRCGLDGFDHDERFVARKWVTNLFCLFGLANQLTF